LLIISQISNTKTLNPHFRQTEFLPNRFLNIQPGIIIYINKMIIAPF
jgi:hypothetical protein